jgi:tetratricopeptide (TPR) repeat protein
VSTRLATAISLAASIWGPHLCAQTLAGARSGIAAAQTFADGPSLPEDSPQAHADNLIFYNSARGAELTPAPEPATSVSVEQLQHPLSRKAAKMLGQARNFAAMGRHDQAIAQLQTALKERSAIPYAHSMLGVEYLKANQLPDAIAELEQAVALLPRNVADRSNLGYALLLSRDFDRAEAETRQALELDRNNAKTQHVLNQILAARRSRSARANPDR